MLRCFAVLLLLPLISHTCRAQAPIGSICKVDRVVDGDTFYCDDRTKVRLLGIDSPERGQGSTFVSASRALERWLPRGRSVVLEGDVRSRDRYGRALAWVWAGDTLVNEAMVSAGWAVRYTLPPNIKYVDRLGQAEREARGGRRGLWASGGLDCKPADFRRARCTAGPLGDP